MRSAQHSMLCALSITNSQHNHHGTLGLVSMQQSMLMNEQVIMLSYI